MFARFLLAFRRLAEDERGATLVEYALLVSLIALVAFSAVGGFGNSLGNLMQSAFTTLGAIFSG